jgi:hypothetical protein
MKKLILFLSFINLIQLPAKKAVNKNDSLVTIKNNLFLNSLTANSIVITSEATLNTLKTSGPISIEGSSLSLPGAIIIKGIPQAQSVEELTHYLGIDGGGNGVFILPHNHTRGLALRTITPFGTSTLLSINSTTEQSTTCTGPVTCNVSTIFLDAPLQSNIGTAITIGQQNTIINVPNLTLSGNTTHSNIFVSDTANNFSLKGNTINITGATTINEALTIAYNQITPTTLTGPITLSGLPKNKGASKTLVGYHEETCYAFTPSHESLEAEKVGEITNQVGSDLAIYGGHTAGVNIASNNLFITAESINFLQTTHCTIEAPESVTLTNLTADVTTIQGKGICGGTAMSIQGITTTNKNNTYPAVAKQIFTANGGTIIFDTNNLPQGFVFLTSHAPEKETSGTYLVLDSNYELHTLAPSSERYKENITPLKISKKDFLKYFLLTPFTTTENDTVYLGIDIEKLSLSPFESILNYTTENSSPHSFEETALMAVAFTQKNHIEKEIDELEEKIISLEEEFATLEVSFI